MNCDTAFDLMTDADGARSLALANHLADCPRCRQMQDTLAPALDFLAECGPGHSVEPFASTFDAASSSASRQPLVTAQALRIAHETAMTLTALSETRHERWRRLAGHGVRYAAVFAAGLLLAFTLFESRQPPVPKGQCTRHDADRDGQPRTAAEIRALARSCAVCHDTTETLPDGHASSLGLRRPQDLEWFQRILCGDTLVAGAEQNHGISDRNSVCRDPASKESGPSELA